VRSKIVRPRPFWQTCQSSTSLRECGGIPQCACGITQTVKSPHMRNSRFIVMGAFTAYIAISITLSGSLMIGTGYSRTCLDSSSCRRQSFENFSNIGVMRSVTRAVLISSLLWLVVALFVSACSGESGRSDVPETASFQTVDAAAGVRIKSRMPTLDEMVRNTYNVAYEECAHRPEGVYQEGGSKNIHDAAEWYSKVSREGAHRAASYRGCADALLGREKGF
jgi:hypothetical protein